MLRHTNLYVYYKLNFILAQHHKYSIEDIENMIPFERDIYVDLLAEHIREQKENNNG